MVHLNGKKVPMGSKVTIANLPVDQEYNPESEKAQSGKAVAQAVDTVIPNGFEVVAEGELTEAVNSILVTTDKNGDALNLQDIISFYFYSPKAEKDNYVTIKLNNSLLTQVPTVKLASENYSKAISIYSGCQWEAFLVNGGGSSATANVQMRNTNEFTGQQMAKADKINRIQMYCYNSDDTLPVGFKYKVYGRRAK